MDERLRDLHQQELTESRVNEDFVVWLKSKGPSYLLLALIAVCGYLGVLRWQQYRADRFNEAWATYLSSRLPGAYEDVAVQFANIHGMPQQALRSAGDTLLNAVQTGRKLGSEPTTPAEEAALAEGDREDYLSRAENYYKAVLDGDDDSLPMTLYAVSALQGLAVVAESRGNAAESAQFYEMAAKRADPWYPDLATRVRSKAGTAEANVEAIVLPTDDSLPKPSTEIGREPVTIDPVLSDLLPSELAFPAVPPTLPGTRTFGNVPGG